MLSVLKRIEEQQVAYAKAPFFAFLRDRNVDVRERLAFAPHVAHFVLTFADLCEFVLPQQPPADRYQRAGKRQLSGRPPALALVPLRLGATRARSEPAL